MMKAYVLQGINNLTYENVDMPVLENGWALIEVKAAGVCGSDIPRIFETGTYHFPTIPGHEFSGIVKSVGTDTDSRLIGKRVGVFPLIPCRQCFCCKDGYYEMCRNYNYLGSRTDGGFAEYVKVPVWNLLELPDTVTFEEAAMLEPASVAHHALSQFGNIKDKTIVIFGAGPIGLMAAQFARCHSASKVLLVVNREEQLQKARELGFDYICNSKTSDVIEWIRELTGSEGADCVMEGVGSSDVLAQCLKCVRPKGEIVVMGNPHDDLHLDKNVYWQLLRKQLKLLGTWNSGYNEKQNDWKEVLAAMEHHNIVIDPLITHKLSFDQLMNGLMIMKNKSEYYCKVMICKDTMIQRR